MLMFDLDDFKPVTPEDKPVFDKHYAKYPPNHSENVFTTLISWSHFVQPYYLVHGDNLIIMTRVDGQVRFRSPSGPRNPEVPSVGATFLKEFVKSKRFPSGELRTDKTSVSSYCLGKLCNGSSGYGARSRSGDA